MNDIEIIKTIDDYTISIDWDCKTIDIEDNINEHVFLEFDDLDEYIETLQKIKEKIKEEME